MITNGLHIRNYVSLKEYCTYKAGGTARYFAEPRCTHELKTLLEYASTEQLPYYVMGGGSNVLFADKLFDGLVVNLRNLNHYITLAGNCVVEVGAGVKLDEFVQFAIAESLGGAENFSGIPGCVGGACIMNAGAFHTEIKDIVTTIEVLEDDGSQKEIDANSAKFSYRCAEGLKGKIVLSAKFRLKASQKQILEASRRDILLKRKEKQPLDMPSCGSVFKRPKNGYAGTLIEEAGLKGFAIGGAMVSEKHANFIVNKGDATATDIYNIINHIKKRVLEVSGSLLEEEVKLINF